MKRTRLQSKENNIKVIKDDNQKVLLSDVIDSIKFRISKHYEFIEKDYEIIQNNIGFSNVIEDALIRIKSREDKIDELNEFLEYCL